tara:strand:+ start:1082 stop:1258 length:177 start_codon:yes stop_codon:yes gene_type:complete
MQNIKSAKYGAQNGVNNCVVVTTNTDEKIFIPIDPDNADYAEILRQVAAGALTIEDAD